MMDRDLATAIADLRNHLDITAESLRSDIRTVAEGVAPLDDKLERTASDSRSEMHGGFQRPRR